MKKKLDYGIIISTKYHNHSEKWKEMACLHNIYSNKSYRTPP